MLKAFAVIGKNNLRSAFNIRWLLLAFGFLVSYGHAIIAEAQSSEVEYIAVDDIKAALETCAPGSGVTVVLKTYLEQIERINYEDNQQYSYVTNEEVQNFVLEKLLAIPTGKRNCTNLLSLYFGVIEKVSENADRSSLSVKDENSCSPAFQWNSCRVITSGGGLNLRKMPGVVHPVSRLDGFLNGERVKATCTFGNWALVYGDVVGQRDKIYGWSHRRYLDCASKLIPDEIEWEG